MAPPTAPIVETERLRLIRIWDTELGSEHLKWFHETWSDPVATQWSLHGPTTTLLSSQTWFKTHLSTYDSILYMIFEKTPSAPYPGRLIGNIGLRTQEAGPTMPPFDPPVANPSNPQDTSAQEVSTQEASGDTTSARDTSAQNPSENPPTENTTPTLNLRSLGYSLLAPSWGQGFATEAATAIIEAYREGTKEEREKGKERYYVEAIWGPENVASARVLAKVGFRVIGEKKEKKAWLAGGWRERLVVGGLYV